MLYFFKKNKFHFLVWIIMLVYLFAAHDLYNHFILTEGKPIQCQQDLPKGTQLIKYRLKKLNSNIISGQDINILSGTAFLRKEPDQSQYERLIVLQSHTKMYFFPVINIIKKTGILVNIAKEFIKPGTYRIGILFRHKIKDTVFYTVTNKTIIRTPNNIKIASLPSS